MKEGKKEAGKTLAEMIHCSKWSPNFDACTGYGLYDVLRLRAYQHEPIYQFSNYLNL